MLTVLSPFIVLGLVVFVHELGHFIAAKSMRVYAPVFALGWGSRLVGFRRGETDYRLAWLPLGGYVQMASANDETMRAAGDVNTAMITDAGFADIPSTPDADGPRRGFNPVGWDPNAMYPFGPKPVPPDRWLESKPLLARLWILSAGVIMNFLLAYVVLVVVALAYGGSRLLPVVGDVQANSPAARAGLVANDRIAAVNGRPVEWWEDMVAVVRQSPEQDVQLRVRRAGAERELTVRPAAVTQPDSASGASRRVGQIGVLPSADSVVRRPMAPARAFGAAWRIEVGMFTGVLDVLKKLVLRQVSVRELGGPIAIARVSVQAAKQGIEDLLGLIAFLSVNIAVLNLLPIPVLDGGQMLYTIAERVRGRPFAERTRERFFQVGTVLVLLLIVTVMWNDITRLVTGGAR
jgi:regulator of sigma E protease